MRSPQAENGHRESSSEHSEENAATSHWRSHLAGVMIAAVDSVSKNTPATLYDRIGGQEGLLKLITPFYAKVRQHPVLGPIFNGRIADWPQHLAKIAGFWSGMTGGPMLYPGGMGRHFSLGIGDEHFMVWLGLWDENASALLPAPEAAEMSELAHAVGVDLQRMITRFKPQFGREFDVQTDE